MMEPIVLNKVMRVVFTEEKTAKFPCGFTAAPNVFGTMDGFMEAGGQRARRGDRRRSSQVSFTLL